jgi:DNA-binding GntR family transcriptional regulator
LLSCLLVLARDLPVGVAMVTLIYDFIKSKPARLRVATGWEAATVTAGGGSPTPRLRTVVTVQHGTLLWLREQIASGAYRPGTQLRQEVLAHEFGVSVPPVREALKTLEAEGQVVYAPHRGYFVAQLSAAELAETYRIRDLLETEAIERSVPTLARVDVARMREAIRDMEDAHRGDDLPGLTAANRRFHFTLFDAAGMPRMAELIRVLWDSTDRYRSIYYSTRAHRSRVNQEHRAIHAAVRAHDAARAVALLRAHREHALAALRRALPDGAPGDDGATATPCDDEGTAGALRAPSVTAR